MIAHVAGLPFEELLFALPAVGAAAGAIRAWAWSLRHREPSSR